MESIINIRGWKPGFNKVSMTHLLRTHAALSLNEAKSITDRVLEGRLVSLELRESHKIHQLARELEAIGAMISVSERQE